MKRRMTVAALIAAHTEKRGTMGAGSQPERPLKCYHEFGDWRGETMTNDSGRPDCNHTFWVRSSGAWVNQSGQGNVITR